MSSEPDVSQRMTRQWYKSLKCSICLDYYVNPHTLKCGHSFCVRCLCRLEQIARDQNPASYPNQVRLSCPTCRRPISVKAITKRQLTVNYSLQDFVENWLDEQNAIGRQTIQVRSVGSQSGDEGESEDEESSEVSRVEFGEVPVRQIMPILSNSEMDSIANQVQERQHRTNASCENTSDDSDESYSTVYSNNNTGPVVRNIRPAMSLTMIIKHVLIEICDVITDVIRCPNRSVMAIVWGGYTFSIMLISSGFFPYMLLYSVLFFLILYAETVEQRRADRERRRAADALAATD